MIFLATARNEKERLAQAFRQALPELRSALMGLQPQQKHSWAEHVVHATVGLAAELGHVYRSPQVEELMLKEVFIDSQKRGAGLKEAFERQITLWEAKRKKHPRPVLCAPAAKHLPAQRQHALRL